MIWKCLWTIVDWENSIIKLCAFNNDQYLLCALLISLTQLVPTMILWGRYFLCGCKNGVWRGQRTSPQVGGRAGSTTFRATPAVLNMWSLAQQLCISWKLLEMLTPRPSDRISGVGPSHRCWSKPSRWIHVKFGEPPLYGNPTSLEILSSECICWYKNISDELVTKIFTASSLDGEIGGDCFLWSFVFFFPFSKVTQWTFVTRGKKKCS